MDREKLIDIITEANAFYVTDKEDIGIADRYEMSHKLADHLIANGIGDIAAEKHRADVAEEALRLACNDVRHNYYMTRTEALIDNYKQQAESD